MSNIGLDLGTHSIKVVELKQTNSSPLITNFAVFESEKLLFDLNVPEKLDFYVSKLRDYFSSVSFNSSDVNLTIPDSEVFLSVREFPKMSIPDLRNHINLQAQEIFPENINSLSYDLRILEEEKDGNIEVLIIAAKKHRIEQYIDILKRCDLTPMVIESRCISNSRIIDSYDKNKAVMILDFGFNSSMIQISSEKVPRFVKNIPIGSSTFNRTLVQNLSLNLIQAEEYKKVYGMDPSVAEGKIYEYLKPLADSFILDIKRAIVYFIEKHKHMELTKIYLTGGLSKMPSLREYFAKNLNYPVEIFDLFSKVRVSSDLSKYENELKSISPVIVTATGASGVNILWVN